MDRGPSATAPTGPSSTGRVRARSSTASSRSLLVPTVSSSRAPWWPSTTTRRWLGDELEAQLGGEKHNWLFGVEVAERRDEFIIVPGQLEFISLFNPVETATSRPPAIPGLSEAGDAERRIIAPYVTDRWLLSEHWQVLWGARVDVLESDDDLTGASSDDEEISPFVGITWAPSATLTGYLNAGRSVAPPSTRAGSLEPEESEQLELGMKNVFFDGRMHLTVAAYQLEREDIAIFDDNGFTAQTGSQRSRGVEVELAGSIGDGFRYQIACARSTSELTEFNELVFPPPFFQPTIVDHSGNDPAFAPEDLWNFWVAKTFRAGSAWAGAAGWWATSSSPRTTSSSSTRRSPSTPPRSTTSTTGRWRST